MMIRAEQRAVQVYGAEFVGERQFPEQSPGARKERLRMVSVYLIRRPRSLFIEAADVTVQGSWNLSPLLRRNTEHGQSRPTFQRGTHCSHPVTRGSSSCY